MTASPHIRSLHPEDLPPPIFNLTDGTHIWAIRQPVSVAPLSPALAEAAQYILEAAQYLDAAGTEASLVSFPPVRYSASLDLFPEAYAGSGTPGFSPAALASCLPRKSLANIKPERVSEPANPRLERALAKLSPSGSARQYRSLVENFAKRFDLSTELVMAIIHSESHFSPALVSSKSAMGLMQLLPSTASDEVHRFLYGRRGNVNFEQLSNPEINIRYGTAYLHILHNRYFSNVRDKHVREACVIASYNLGPNRFLKLYGSTNQQAVNKINSMTPAEFHADLPRRLPVAETRFYVEKVKRMKQHYTGLQ